MKMNTQTIARMSLLTAVALVLGYFERFIPLTATMPGIKLGLGNTVLLYAIYMMSNRHAFGLMVLKVVLSGLLFAGLGGAMYSFAGGLLSLVVMLLLKRVQGISILGISVAGAVFHNVGQLAMAATVVQTRSLVLYFPVLLVAGVVTGIMTGLVAKYVLKGLHVNATAMRTRDAS
ncbi:Gx transporter family protein [Anoxynatronum buryatiense]|uniref:Heptaprenyl diphosphate synthase n=1 Tax=Anoxynatronum buryatiense TaxID=489973 RepID=A0AA46AJH3_9CLOT|nr:Gx transporter family protein [Anoxynatronum buryatiense]SMP61516.1 heptaprenyl diphosphate synthase [Anoxynatronum buryatiense]